MTQPLDYLSWAKLPQITDSMMWGEVELTTFVLIEGICGSRRHQRPIKAVSAFLAGTSSGGSSTLDRSPERLGRFM